VEPPPPVDVGETPTGDVNKAADTNLPGS
jgi:hypothetical protein